MCVFGLPKRASASLAFAASSTRQPSSASLRLVIRRTTAVCSTTRTVYEVATPPPRGSRGAISARVRIDTVRVVTYVGRVAALVPFFGTLFSTLLPALFALGVSGLPKALAVLAIGVAVHLIEANVVAPVVMERQVNIPPVITIAGVLLIGKLFGLAGLVVAVPILVVVLILVRHILLGEVYGDRVSETEPSGTVPTDLEPAITSRPPAS